MSVFVPRGRCVCVAVVCHIGEFSVLFYLFFRLQLSVIVCNVFVCIFRFHQFIVDKVNLNKEPKILR